MSASGNALGGPGSGAEVPDVVTEGGGSVISSPVSIDGPAMRMKRCSSSSVTDVLGDIEEKLLAQRRLQLLEKGEHLSLLCCGEAGCGKTSLLNSLFGQRLPGNIPPTSPTLSLIESKIDLEIGPVKIRLTTIDTPGYGDSMDLGESFEKVADHISNRFQRAIERERRPNRPNMDVLDETVGVDAVLYFIAPHRLKHLDITFMRRLHGIATIVPIIAKADVYTRDELRSFRTLVSTRLEEEGIDVPCQPFAVICAQNPDDSDERPRPRGREYPWGMALSEHEGHSDLPALRKFLLTDGLMDLHERRRMYFEKYRCNLAVCKGDLSKSIMSRVIALPRLLIGFALRTAIILFAARLIQNRAQPEEEEKPKRRRFLNLF